MKSKPVRPSSLQAPRVGSVKKSGVQLQVSNNSIASFTSFSPCSVFRVVVRGENRDRVYEFLRVRVCHGRDVQRDLLDGHPF